MNKAVRKRGLRAALTLVAAGAATLSAAGASALATTQHPSAKANACNAKIKSTVRMGHFSGMVRAVHVRPAGCPVPRASIHKARRPGERHSAALVPRRQCHGNELDRSRGRDADLLASGGSSHVSRLQEHHQHVPGRRGRRERQALERVLDVERVLRDQRQPSGTSSSWARPFRTTIPCQQTAAHLTPRTPPRFTPTTPATTLASTTTRSSPRPTASWPRATCP